MGARAHTALWRQAWRTTQQVFFQEDVGGVERPGDRSPSADSSTSLEARNHGGPPGAGTPYAMCFELCASLLMARSGICLRPPRNSWAQCDHASSHSCLGAVTAAQAMVLGLRADRLAARLRRIWNDASLGCECSRCDSQACRLHSLVSWRASDDLPLTRHLAQRSSTILCVATSPSTSSRTKYTPEATRSPELAVPSQPTVRYP